MTDTSTTAPHRAPHHTADGAFGQGLLPAVRAGRVAWLLLAGVGLGAPNLAQAGPQIAISLGFGTDLTDGRGFALNCSGKENSQSYTPYAPTADSPPDAATECHNWGPRPVGRLRVPVRFALSELAAVEVFAGVDVGQQMGRLQWSRTAGCPYVAGEHTEIGGTASAPCLPTSSNSESYEYQGVFALSAVPHVGAGFEAGARLGPGLQLTGGVGLSLSYLWTFQSIDQNTNGKHGYTGQAFTFRSGSHCNTDTRPDGDGCDRDLVQSTWVPGAELSVGLRSRSERPVFARLSYSLLGPHRGYARDYDPLAKVAVRSGWNPLMLTVGAAILP